MTLRLHNDVLLILIKSFIFILFSFKKKISQMLMLPEPILKISFNAKIQKTWQIFFFLLKSFKPLVPRLLLDDWGSLSLHAEQEDGHPQAQNYTWHSKNNTLKMMTSKAAAQLTTHTIRNSQAFLLWNTHYRVFFKSWYSHCKSNHVLYWCNVTNIILCCNVTRLHYHHSATTGHWVQMTF